MTISVLVSTVNEVFLQVETRMKIIFALVFSIWFIHVVEAIVILHHGGWTFKTGTLEEVGEDEELTGVHMYRFMRDVTKDNDFVIHYFFTTEESSLNGTVRFCDADVSTLDGTVAAIAARCLGLDVVDGTSCPVEAGVHTIQWSVFSMEQASSDVFFVNGVSLVELIMAVHAEDWGIIVEVLTDELGAKYSASFNQTES